MATKVGLGLGANLGDRAGMLLSALEAIDDARGLKLTAVSRAFASEPWGVIDQPDFLNLCALGETDLAPLDVLAVTQAIEHKLGRVPSYRWGPRLIDIDILFCGEARLQVDGLVLPHPRMTERLFVLAPLAELCKTAPGVEGSLELAIAAERARHPTRIEVDEPATAAVQTWWRQRQAGGAQV